MLDQLTVEEFARCLHQGFRLHIDDQRTVEVELIEVKTLGEGPQGAPAGRAPFSLVFRGSTDTRLQQRIFKIEHATLGAYEIFLVPIGVDENGMRFEAVFN